MDERYSADVFVVVVDIHVYFYEIIIYINLIVVCKKFKVFTKGTITIGIFSGNSCHISCFRF
jgi:hypothetical protein